MTERNDAHQPGLPAIPDVLRPFTDGAAWESVSIGASGALVYRLRRPGSAPRYLKIAPPPLDVEARDEVSRLAWLHGRLPVPEALAVCADATATWLLLTEVPGVMSCEARFAGDVPSVARLLARGLRMIHRLDIAACPFDRRLNRTLALARERCAAGLVDEADFDEQRQGLRAPDVLAQLEATRPAAEDLVFTHGDYCLPNVFLDSAGTRLTGFVDWGRAGVADRYQDLALAARSLRHNFGPGWESYLFEAYGLATVDDAKLAYYELLDELF
ncbi:MAG TPA: APH(3') family aminoglycoside O-phosphotransferase [Ktedonobacterales bacterium]|nr:APH(3') family aminoglycoside O-phosphotransferase [Ktedonobacterales bacterium]